MIPQRLFHRLQEISLAMGVVSSVTTAYKPKSSLVARTWMGSEAFDPPVPCYQRKGRTLPRFLVKFPFQSLGYRPALFCNR